MGGTEMKKRPIQTFKYEERDQAIETELDEIQQALDVLQKRKDELKKEVEQRNKDGFGMYNWTWVKDHPIFDSVAFKQMLLDYRITIPTMKIEQEVEDTESLNLILQAHQLERPTKPSKGYLKQNTGGMKE
jgi:hypothetical protein